MRYLWLRPGTDLPSAKLARIVSYKPWGWALVAGVYVDDIEEAFYASLARSAGGLALVSLLLSMIVALVNRSLIRTLGGSPEYAVSVAMRIAEQDLSQPVKLRKGANLMLASMDGPAGLTRYIRTLGDELTRLDRNEPTLNEATPGDPRDTTTPAAMLATMQRLTLGDVLSPGGRAQLLAWLRANRTGDARLRAGLPPGWQAGDRTGTGPNGTSNDVGLLWPPGGSPLLVAAYLTEGAADMATRDAALADVGAAVAAAWRDGT